MVRSLYESAAKGLAVAVAMTAVVLQAPAASGPGEACGGIAGLRCRTGLACGMVGPPHPDQGGVCRAPEGGRRVCPQSYRPVCGSDGETYPNACVAGSRGVAVAHEGACQEVGAPASPSPGSASVETRWPAEAVFR